MPTRRMVDRVPFHSQACPVHLSIALDGSDVDQVYRGVECQSMRLSSFEECSNGFVVLLLVLWTSTLDLSWFPM